MVVGVEEGEKEEQRARAKVRREERKSGGKKKIITSFLAKKKKKEKTHMATAWTPANIGAKRSMTCGRTSAIEERPTSAARPTNCLGFLIFFFQSLREGICFFVFFDVDFKKKKKRRRVSGNDGKKKMKPKNNNNNHSP